MDPAPKAIDTLQRLVDQVHALSAVTETLTLRLLDLEERVLRQERLAVASRTPSLDAPAARRLAETEERLQELEQMLAAMPVLPATPSQAEPAAIAAVPSSIDGRDSDPALDGEAAAAPVVALTDGEGWDAEDDWSESEPVVA